MTTATKRVGSETTHDRPVNVRRHLSTLVGQTIETYTGRPNRILELAGEFVVVGTAKSPGGKPVPIAEVQAAADHLWRDGQLEISVREVGYRSAFVGAALATLPGVRWGHGRVLVLDR